MRVGGKMTRCMEKEGSFMLMVMFMMVLGKIIKRMVKVPLQVLMAENIQGNGYAINKMVMEKKLGLMATNTLENTSKL